MPQLAVCGGKCRLHVRVPRVRALLHASTSQPAPPSGSFVMLRLGMIASLIRQRVLSSWAGKCGFLSACADPELTFVIAENLSN